MSIAFSKFSVAGNVNRLPAPFAPAGGGNGMSLRAGVAGATQTSSAGVIGYGMGWGALATITPRPNPGLLGNFIVPNGPVLAVAGLNTDLLRLANRWWMNDSEMERRTAINSFLQTFIHRLDHALIGIYQEITVATVPPNRRVSLALPGQQYLGHGILDYYITAPAAVAAPPQPPAAVVLAAGAAGVGRAALAALTPTNIAGAAIVPPPPDWTQGLVIEAKYNLVDQQPTARWQLCAIMGTLAQMLPLPAPMAPRYVRGILTDGRFWQFYQYSTAFQTFHCSPMIDATVTVGGGVGMPAGVAMAGGGVINYDELVLRMLRKFVLLWNQTNVDGWI
ncbi:hypothetical protein [Elstera cyanobacteriorum]|uniref:hypothetical protein n=1 Tax=Elstera cyanobacteriorum TaxID=2022747 RepID=UPI00235498F2|nr:hypothetical protein [Elstera cyanobacteriorum]MCK6442925.1 DUF4344 domain-containing metallopeptidase [Elstera cyanobacteriorum]